MNWSTAATWQASAASSLSLSLFPAWLLYLAMMAAALVARRSSDATTKALQKKQNTPGSKRMIMHYREALLQMKSMDKFKMMQFSSWSSGLGEEMSHPAAAYGSVVVDGWAAGWSVVVGGSGADQRPLGFVLGAVGVVVFYDVILSAEEGDDSLGWRMTRTWGGEEKTMWKCLGLHVDIITHSVFKYILIYTQSNICTPTHMHT